MNSPSSPQRGRDSAGTASKPTDFTGDTGGMPACAQTPTPEMEGGSGAHPVETVDESASMDLGPPAVPDAENGATPAALEVPQAVATTMAEASSPTSSAVRGFETPVHEGGSGDGDRGMDSQVPREPNSTSILKGVASPKSTATGGSPEGGGRPFDPGNGGEFAPATHSATLSQEKRRCTAKDPFWTHATHAAHSEAPAAAARNGSEACRQSLAVGPLRCLGDVIAGIDREHELEVPEAEISTVHIETWEQRLDWRSFLSEAVASSKARQLWADFDVEAEPPHYARPPPSTPCTADEVAMSRERPSPHVRTPQPPTPSSAGGSPTAGLRGLDVPKGATSSQSASSSAEISHPIASALVGNGM